MQATARYRGDGTYRVTGSVSGASIIVDTRTHGTNAPQSALGPRPMELVLFGASTCPAVDLVQILGKMRHPATDLIVEVDGERADTHPRRFTRISLRFRIFGQDIAEDAAERAVRLSVERYCSALASLNAEVSWSVSVEPDQAPGMIPDENGGRHGNLR